jgi:hypothetical protein
MRIIGFILFSLFLLPTPASAQAPTRVNVFGGYSYYNTDLSPLGRASTYGWEGTLEVKAFHWVSIVGDMDTHYGTQAFPLCQTFPTSGHVCSTYTADIIERNFLGGPRLSLQMGNFRPFVELLAGDAHVNAGAFAGTDDSFASGLGGGVDSNLTHRFAWRVQADYIHTQFFSAHQNTARVSTGLVLRF